MCILILHTVGAKSGNWRNWSWLGNECSGTDNLSYHPAFPQYYSQANHVPKRKYLNHNLKRVLKETIFLTGENHSWLISAFHRVGFQKFLLLIALLEEIEGTRKGLLNTCCSEQHLIPTPAKTAGPLYGDEDTKNLLQ